MDNREIVSRCKYCGRNYAYTKVDPGHCGAKKCKESYNNDAFAVRRTDAGKSSNIAPIEFGNKPIMKVVKSGGKKMAKEAEKKEISLGGEFDVFETSAGTQPKAKKEGVAGEETKEKRKRGRPRKNPAA